MTRRGRAHAKLQRARLDYLRRLRGRDIFLEDLALPGQLFVGLLQLADLERPLCQRGADHQRGDERPAEQDAQQQHERHPSSTLLGSGAPVIAVFPRPVPLVSRDGEAPLRLARAGGPAEPA